MVYPISKLFFRIIRFLLIKNVEGLENIPEDGPFIVAANHQSHLDGFLIAAYVIQIRDQKIHFFAKQEFTSYFGAFIENLLYKKWADCIFVEKEGTKQRGLKAIKQASILLGKGELVGIFPEGTRTKTGSLQEGRTGIVRVLFNTKKDIPIVPVGINDAHQMLPREKMIPRIWRARASIKFGKPFSLKNLKKQKVTKRMLRKTTTFIMKKIAKEAGKKYANT